MLAPDLLALLAAPAVANEECEKENEEWEMENDPCPMENSVAPPSNPARFPPHYQTYDAALPEHAAQAFRDDLQMLDQLWGVTPLWKLIIGCHVADLKRSERRAGLQRLVRWCEHWLREVLREQQVEKATAVTEVKKEVACPSASQWEMENKTREMGNAVAVRGIPIYRDPPVQEEVRSSASKWEMENDQWKMGNSFAQPRPRRPRRSQ